jgi:hypothetical protein
LSSRAFKAVCSRQLLIRVSSYCLNLRLRYEARLHFRTYEATQHSGYSGKVLHCYRGKLGSFASTRHLKFQRLQNRAVRSSMISRRDSSFKTITFTPLAPHSSLLAFSASSLALARAFAAASALFLVIVLKYSPRTKVTALKKGTVSLERRFSSLLVDFACTRVKQRDNTPSLRRLSKVARSDVISTYERVNVAFSGLTRKFCAIAMLTGPMTQAILVIGQIVDLTNRTTSFDDFAPLIIARLVKYTVRKGQQLPPRVKLHSIIR